MEEALKGKVLDEDAVRDASLLAVEGAVDHGANHYKIELAPRVVARAILKTGSHGMTVHDLRTRHGDASDGSADQVGGRLSRVDGPAKITGAAKYAVEQQLEGLAHAVLVESTIRRRQGARDRHGSGGRPRPACSWC